MRDKFDAACIHPKRTSQNTFNISIDRPQLTVSFSNSPPDPPGLLRKHLRKANYGPPRKSHALLRRKQSTRFKNGARLIPDENREATLTHKHTLHPTPTRLNDKKPHNSHGIVVVALAVNAAERAHTPAKDPLQRRSAAAAAAVRPNHLARALLMLAVAV